MTLCTCHRIADRDITHAMREDCTSFDELQDQTREATSACGTCHECGHQRFHEQASAGHVGPMPAAAVAASGTAPAQTALPRWRTSDLFGSAREVEIAHGDAVYRLRQTALGKLILTK